MAAPKQTDPQFKLRLTPELHDQVKAAADKSGRSMNAEMVQRLADSFNRKGLFQIPPYLLERLEAIAASQGRTVRFLIHETLMEKYPPPPVDDEAVDEFMELFRPLDEGQKIRVLHRLRQAIEAYNDQYLADDS